MSEQEISVGPYPAVLSSFSGMARRLLTDEVERDTHSANPDPADISLDDHEGTVFTNVEVQLIFWGIGWATGAEPVAIDDVENAVRTILSGAYLSDLAQYRGIGRGHLRTPSIVDGRTDPPRVVDAQIVSDEVMDILAGNAPRFPQGSFPTPFDNPQIWYCVVVPSGTTDSSGAFGWHASFTFQNPNNPNESRPAAFAVVTYNVELGGLTETLSHELVETVTDPFDDGIRLTYPQSPSFNNDGEVGDVCEGVSTFVDGVKVQAYWSEAARACVAPKVPELSVASAPVGYSTDSSHQHHVVFVGSDQSVHELYYTDNVGWDHNHLSYTVGHGRDPIPNGAQIDGYTWDQFTQQHVNYPDQNGHIWELIYYPKDGWSANDLTSLANIPGEPARRGTPLHGYTTIGQQHVNYVGSDGSVRELVYENGRWHNLSGLANSTGTTVADGSYLAGYTTVGQQHVNYIGSDEHVHELVYSGSRWTDNDLHSKVTNATHVVAAKTGPIGYTSDWNNQQHVVYIGVDDQLHELTYVGNWQSHNLMIAAGMPGDSARSDSSLCAYTTSWNRQQHLIYLGHDNQIHELAYMDDHGWRDYNLMSSAGVPDLAVPDGGAVGAYISPYNRQQHINFADREGHLQELVYVDKAGWRHNDLWQWISRRNLNP